MALTYFSLYHTTLSIFNKNRYTLLSDFALKHFYLFVCLVILLILGL